MRLPRVLPWILLVLLAPSAAAQGADPDFEIEPRNPFVQDTVRFRSTSVPAEGDSITNWTWNFGDDTEAYGQEVTHVYDRAGSFAVSLTVEYGSGRAADVVQQQLDVSERPTGDLFGIIPTWLYWVAPLLVSGALFALAYVVLSRGQPAVYNLVFFLLYLASGLKSFTEALYVLIGDPSDWLWQGAAHLNLLAAFAQGALFLWFVLIFPRPVHPWFAVEKRGALALLLVVPFALADLLSLADFAGIANAYNIFVSILAVSCLGILVYHAWEIDSNEERLRVRLLTLSFGLLVLVSLVLAALDVTQSVLRDAGDPAWVRFSNLSLVFGLVFVPLVEIVSATVLLYAILRFQLLGVDRLVKKITRNSVVGVSVPATFIIVGNAIEELVQSTFLAETDLPVPFIVAGFVATFLMIPIQKWVGFLMNKWFPTLESPEELSLRRMEIYEAQLRYHLLDGALSEKEYQTLRRLRDEMQVLPAELEAIVRRFQGVELAPLQAPAFAPTTPSAS